MLMLFCGKQWTLARPVGWTGGGGNTFWNDPSNWSGNAVPAAGDDVLLDNSDMPSSYLVRLPDIPVTLRSISIRPSAGYSIELLLPASNINNDALLLTGTGYPLLLASGAVFRNACGISSGPSIDLADSFRIENGARYVHSTRGTHASSLLSKLSAGPGTERGIFEFDVPRASYTISVSNRTYGTISLRSTAYGQPVNYTCSGSNPLLVRGDLDIGINVSLSVDLATAKGNIFVGGDLLQQPGTFTLGSGSGDSTQLHLRGNMIQQEGAVLTSAPDAFPWLELDGSVNQGLSAAGTITGNTGLRISNAAGVRLQHALTLAKSLHLSAGALATSTENLLTLDTACVLIADSLARDAFVDGPLRRTILAGTPDALFPVGASGSRRWLALQLASGTFTAQYFLRNPASLAAAAGAGIDHISSNEYWLLQSSGPVSGKVALSHAVPQSGEITEPAALRVAQLLRGEWTDAGESAFTGNLTEGSVISNPVADFSGLYFTLGSALAIENPLPLEQVTLAVKRVNDQIRFCWTWSDTEEAAAYEIVLADGNEPRPYYRTPAENGQSAYHWAMPDTLSGAAHVWRVDLIDKSGQRRIGKSVSMPEVSARPVLFICRSVAGGSPLLFMRAERPGSCTSLLYAENGASLRQKELAYVAGGNRWPLEPESLRPGTYFLRIRFNDGSEKTLRVLWPNR